MRTIFIINSVAVASYSISKLQTCRKYVTDFPDIWNSFNSLSESKGLQQLETDVMNFQ